MIDSGRVLRFATVALLTLVGCASPNPDALLGAFDRDAFEGRFGIEFSTENLTESGNIEYTGGHRSYLGLGFIVDPNNAIVGTVIWSPLPGDNAATEDEWLAFIAETHPDAAEWLTSVRDDYLAAPGAEVSFTESFGELCVGLLTSGPLVGPTGDATNLWMNAEDCP